MKRPIDLALEKIGENLRRMATATENILNEMGGEMRFSLERIAIYSSEIRGLRAEIHSLVTEAIARYQPVASDLRYLLASLEISYGLFRFSRYALDIAYIIKSASADRGVECEFPTSKKMLPHVINMMRESIESFMKRDREKAKKVIELDSVVDKLMSEAMKKAFETNDRCLYLDFILSVYLERIADHSVYIASDTLFML